MPCCSLLLALNKTTKLYKKRKHLHGDLQYIQNNARIQFPKGLTLVQEKNIYIIYIAWQPNLVLGGLGRALKVPIACEGSILGLSTPSLLRRTK